MSRPRLLLVDDEEAIRLSLPPILERAGFDTSTCQDGLEALQRLQTSPTDIMVCDVMMPRLDGRELVRQMRAKQDWTPVILLTQIDESYERSAALEEGADDYLNKPFDPAELVARVRAVLRRAVPGKPSLMASTRLTSGPLVVDRSARRVWLDDVEVMLTPKASRLLDYLMTHPGELHTRTDLQAALGRFDFPVASRAVDHRIAEIRRVLQDDAAAPRFVQTVQSLGYRFVAPVRIGS
jgi:DNA-binding response OmpR family regulator